MINMTWLRTFCTLAEIGHFTHTAERLHMTQSGVSQHLRKLEEQLGVPLIIRQGKQFLLSREGERVYEEGRTILLSVRNLEGALKENPEFAGAVSVTTPGSLGLKLYPKLLDLQCRHPELMIDHRIAPNSDIEQAVAALEVDIGIMTRQPTDPDIRSEVIASEPLLLVTPAGFDTPDWQTLLSLGFIDHPDGYHHANLLLSANYPAFEHCDRFRKSGFSNQIGLILEPVSRGLGFTVLPAHAVNAFPAQHTIVAHALPTPVSEALFLCTHRHRALLRRHQTVTTAIMAWI